MNSCLADCYLLLAKYNKEKSGKKKKKKEEKHSNSVGEGAKEGVPANQSEDKSSSEEEEEEDKEHKTGKVIEKYKVTEKDITIGSCVIQPGVWDHLMVEDSYPRV